MSANRPRSSKVTMTKRSVHIGRDHPLYEERRPMRVINLVTQLEPGGAQGAAIRMSQQMRLRGHSAQTWFLYKKFDCYQNEPELNVIADSRPNGAIELL